MIKTLGLRHIQINVQDVARAMRFYSDLVGAEEQFRDGAHTVFMSIPGGGDLLTLHQPGQSEPLYGRDRGGLVHFGFALPVGSDMDDAARQVAEAGGEVLSLLRGLQSQFFVCLMPRSWAASSRKRPSSSSRGLFFSIQATAC